MLWGKAGAKTLIPQTEIGLTPYEGIEGPEKKELGNMTRCGDWGRTIGETVLR
jgi:hypothetical protein